MQGGGEGVFQFFRPGPLKFLLRIFPSPTETGRAAKSLERLGKPLINNLDELNRARSRTFF